MADAVTISAVLDATGLELLDHLLDIHGHGTQLGVRHEAAGAEDTAETADLAHEVGRGDDGVEVDVALLDLLDEVVGADDVGAGSLGLGGLGALGKDGNANGLASTVGQRDGATNVLIGLAVSTPRRMATSTVSSNLAEESSLASVMASLGE